jgi:hypothetical protein
VRGLGLTTDPYPLTSTPLPRSGGEGLTEQTLSLSGKVTAQAEPARHRRAMLSRAGSIDWNQLRDRRGGGSGGIEGTLSRCTKRRQTREEGGQSGKDAVNGGTITTAPALTHSVE